MVFYCGGYFWRGNEGGQRHDFVDVDAFQSAVSGSCRCIVLGNPSNLWGDRRG
ncbi:hypothetical protein OAA27_01830 [bacterium]|nr:hypothetical protein [bacterium]